MRRILAAIFLILAASGLIAVVTPRLPEAQTHTFPALDTNNVFTGTNTFPSVISATANPASAGFVRLASGDSVIWRNNANSGDIAFSKTGAASGNIPADTFITGGGSGIAATFFSQGNAADAVVGIFRLPTGGVINWRNQANSGDLGLSKTAADEFQIGGAGFRPSSVLFASLGTPANGVLVYCSDCTIANPCAGGGTGAIAKRLNGSWICN